MTPFTIADLTVLNSGLDTLPNYLSKQTIVLLAVAIILVLVGLVVLFWKGPRNAVESRRRIISGMPVWRELTEKYTTGYFQVPVVGAGTANTEFEVLTGMSARFFGPGEYPYKTRMPDRTAETVAYNLKEYGYGTHAIHNHRATFYGRNHVYANLGFDDFTPLEYMPKVDKTPKNWAKDEVLTSQILKAMDATPDQPDVVFTDSVQGHGKYPQEKVLEDPAITVEECPVEGYQYAFEYFVNQIHEMDQFVGELTAALEQRDEKTILVLYGDHLPALGLEDQDMTSGSLYDTTYVMWDK